GNFKGKGNRIQASSGTITVEVPSEYTYEYTKAIGQVTSSGSYSYKDLGPLTLVEKISVQIHIDGSFRRLNVGDTAAITDLYITGYTIVSPDGVQYGAQVGSSDIGTVTMTGPNTWAVEATFQTSEQSPIYLGVARVCEGNVEDFIPIPLYDFEVVCTGIIMI
ncbi:MAG: hypothetical protein JSV20_07615, partial [Candidatus Bathyarchaeota archaeon]